MKKFTHDATDKIWNFSKPVIVSLRTSKEFSSCISTTIYAKLTSAQYQPVNRPPVFKENIKKNFSIRYIFCCLGVEKFIFERRKRKIFTTRSVQGECRSGTEGKWEKNYCGKLHIERMMTEHGRDFSQCFFSSDFSWNFASFLKFLSFFVLFLILKFSHLILLPTSHFFAMRH